MEYGKLKERLRRRIVLGIGFEGTWGKLDSWDKGRKEMVNPNELGRFSITRGVPNISEDAENGEKEAAISLENENGGELELVLWDLHGAERDIYIDKQKEF